MEAKATVQLSIKEIYNLLCEECKHALKEHIKSKISEQMVEGMLKS